VFSIDFPEHPAIERRLENYLAREKKGLEAALARMARYRRFIDVNIRANGLPPELLFLPLLESRYSVNARSRSGAVGLWQIMGNTSGALGLARDEWVDERRDFWESTEGALRKLAENRERFGDWYLALAAYNCGAGCLHRIISKSGVRDFWELRHRGLLRPETAEYVPAFIALTRLASPPGRSGRASGWEPSPSWERVRLAQSVDLRLLAGPLGVSFDTLREANAELKHPVTPAYDRGYWLKLPAGAAERLNALLADPNAELLKYRFHRLASGDTLYGLSRRYAVALPLLEQANPGLDPRRLAVGGIVRIPVVAETPLPAEPSVPATAGFVAWYSVLPGDTLWSIARSHATTVEAVAAANGRALDDPLKPGETLKVPPRPAAEAGASGGVAE
jgi:membrane-bound lytic murein transglycosylase D